MINMLINLAIMSFINSLSSRDDDCRRILVNFGESSRDWNVKSAHMPNLQPEPGEVRIETIKLNIKNRGVLPMLVGSCQHPQIRTHCLAVRKSKNDVWTSILVNRKSREAGHEKMSAVKFADIHWTTSAETICPQF